VSLAVIAAGTPSVVFASETPLYQPAPDWIVTAAIPDLAKLDAGAPPNLIFDVQQRIENGRLWAYVDSATRIASPEMLAQATSIALPWVPDKGDLIVHELSILRGGERIDLLAKDGKFTVLRREQTLEQRELTGILTATMAVEGLQVGDVLRLRMSITTIDAALGGHVQTVMPVFAAPIRLGFARMRFSWPTATPPKWKLLAEGVTLTPVRNGAYSEVTVTLPVPKQTEMPEDAPIRFRHPPLIELATFKDWADVSRVMAPLYATPESTDPADPIQVEAAAIMRADPTPIGRAERALELVQQKIRYFAVGMNGGNYVPQKPARTWAVRYGDCKAKTLLLLTLLRAMKIEAEPVLANIGLGDIVPDRLPSAMAFDHVLVRATIDGQTLWLDGTGSGARLVDIHDTPPFGYALPVRLAGADLLKIETHANARPMVDLTVDVDESASVDLPSAFDAVAVVHGSYAAALTLAKAQMGEKEQNDAVGEYFTNYLGQGQFSDRSITPDPVTGDVTLKAHGIVNSAWATGDRRRKRALARALDNVTFAPDRSKVAWAAIPVATGAPYGMRYRLRLRLPDQGRGFVIEGEPDMKEQIAGYAISRTTKLDGGIVTVEERIDIVGGEVSVARIPIERDAVATAKARAPRLVAPVATARKWDIGASDPAGATQIKAINAVLTKAIADTTSDDSSAYTTRGSFRANIGDRAGAVADWTKAIAIEPSIDLYLKRAATLYETGDVKAALADAEAARVLDPSSEIAIGRVTRLKAESGDLAGGLALLDQRIGLGGEMRRTFRTARASLIGEYGDPAEAITQFDTLIVDKPGSPSLMNARCWTKGTRSVMLDTAVKDCTRAIELSEDTSGPLDGRAMVWFRLGRFDEALADLDAVLAAEPGRADSRFMRAIVLQQLHRDAEAASELRIARRITPSVDRHYARYGIKAR
jgi:tetratricopeptide (TPR) repeat protein/transglutaminase-like putative cysteine protease